MMELAMAVSFNPISYWIVGQLEKFKAGLQLPTREQKEDAELIDVIWLCVSEIVYICRWIDATLSTTYYNLEEALCYS